MISYEIPADIKLKEPKIPFTNIPNPLGTAELSYGGSSVQYIPLYYLHKALKWLASITIVPLTRLYLKQKLEACKMDMINKGDKNS